MATAPKTGPLTLDEIEAIWRSSTDSTFATPLVEAGEGNGFEVYTQLFTQGARVSQAIDTTFEAAFILPWSGQSSPSAAGAAKATVQVTLTRTGMLQAPLILGSEFWVEEVENDASEAGPVPSRTGRKYFLTEPAVFFPGDPGPVTAWAQAEKPGSGYNNPRPASLTGLPEAGAGFRNDLGTMVVTPGPVVANASPPDYVAMLGDNEPDVPIPDHVGRLVAFDAGANAGQVMRASAYLPPDLSLTPESGGGLLLERYLVVRTSAGAGVLTPGEGCQVLDGGSSLVGWGTVVAQRSVGGGATDTMVRMVTGTAPLSGSVVGAQSSASVTISHRLWLDQPRAETAAGTWYVLDWEADVGLAASNAARPMGGRLDTLGARGSERGIPRADGESDDSYLDRVSKLADVVSPNALLRALYRTLGTRPFSFRESGQETYPGFFFDRDAWDLDLVTITGHRHGFFLDAEPVTQFDPSTGKVASGRYAQLLRSDGSFLDVGVSAPRGDFQAGIDIVGEWSGSTWTPTTVGTGLREDDRYRTVLGYEQMRAYFFVGLPRGSDGESGFAYDVGSKNAWDVATWDGAPWAMATLYKAVAAEMSRTKAGGTGFELFIEG